MVSIIGTRVLILAIAMVARLPLEEVVGNYGRLALAVLGSLVSCSYLGGYSKTTAFG
jgi:hypothetical protein